MCVAGFIRDHQEFSKSGPVEKIHRPGFLQFYLFMYVLFCLGFEDETEVFFHFFLLFEFCHVDISAH